MARRCGYDPYIISYNHSTDTWSSAVKIASNPLSSDSHGAPVILVNGSGYIHVFYGSHVSDQKYAISDNPENITAWTVQSNPSTMSTYPKPVRLENGSIYVFFRKSTGASGKHQEAYIRSDDNGLSWGAVTVIIEVNSNTHAIYAYTPQVDDDNDTHLSWRYHDGSNSEGVYHAYLNTTDGHMYSMSGTDLGASITKTEADASCRVVDTGAYVTCHMALHLDGSGYPYIIYCKTTATGWSYYFVRWSGAAWESVEEITTTDHGNNGMDFIVSSATNVTAFLIGDGGAGQGGDIDEWGWNGSTWDMTGTILTEGASGKPLIQPEVVKDYVLELRLIFSQYGGKDVTGLELYAVGAPIPPVGEELIDSYTDAGTYVTIKDLHPSDSARTSANGQSFTSPATRFKITRAEFLIYKTGSPTGDAHAVLYAHSGVYGTSSVPTGAPLATSDSFDVSTLGGAGVYIMFNFTGAQQVDLTPDTYYVIALEGPTAGTINDVSDWVNIRRDATGAHSGNRIRYTNGAWAAEAAHDVNFYLYGVSYNSTITSMTIPDMDDSDNCYAMKYYNFTVVLDDDTGADNISKVYLQGQQEGAVRFEVRATDLNSTPTVWAIQTGATIINLNSTACSWDEDGDTGTAIFNLAFEWDYPYEEDLEFAVYVEDTNGGSTGFTVMQNNYTDVITRLVTYGLGPNQTTVSINNPIEITGYVRYATTGTGDLASSSYPPDAQFTSVQIQNDETETVATDTVIVNGFFNSTFNASSTLGTTLYYVYLDLLDDYVDGLAPDGDYVAVTTTSGFYISWLIDEAFSVFGIVDYIANATAYGTALGTYFIDSISNIMQLITQQFLLILGIFDFFIDWYTRMVSLVISIGSAITGLLDGTGTITTGLGNIWDFISIGTWIDVIPVFLFIWWVESIATRGERQGEITVFFGDLSTVFNVTSWLLSMFGLVINTVTDLAFRLLGVIT